METQCGIIDRTEIVGIFCLCGQGAQHPQQRRAQQRAQYQQAKADSGGKRYPYKDIQRQKHNDGGVEHTRGDDAQGILPKRFLRNKDEPHAHKRQRRALTHAV